MTTDLLQKSKKAVLIQRYSLARKAQGFRAVKMNATEDIGWLDSPSTLQSAVGRLKTVKELGMDAGMDFHGRIHKPMAKQLARALEPHHPLFIEEPLLSEHIGGIKSLHELTSVSYTHLTLPTIYSV